MMNLKQFKIAMALGLTLLVSACGNGEPKANVENKSTEKKTIVVAFGPSSYGTQFTTAIQPMLEAQGYEVVPRVFSQNAQINRSMKDGEVDASIFQSVAYMEDINRLLGMDMVKLADTASAPQSLRSSRHQSLDAIKDGMTITVPNDPVNAERAARILENLGWIKIKAGVDPVKFSVNDIEKGQYDLVIKEVDPAQALRSIDDVDFAVINGNYIANMGLKITDSLIVEDTPAEHVVMVSILGKDQDQQWAKDLKKAYESKEFENYIKNEPLYDGFIFPKHWDN
ncbi:MetQ/NlpA family ABC transporter substrate-binding protein [Wohlfahrtiimonas populi]|uniref:MetQ/NlpA family ABC transporter substrate-binding protein n=1 Tax=Wohlfahrtiimonas populi TaxID=1940240 RepID=UPI00098CFD31|nr:MetQ/NlpA family ABC transporter substrate-binding protein [Wohlfahrtiimonas populi]